MKRYWYWEPSFISPYDSRISSWRRTWESSSNWEHYDRIILDEVEVARIIQQLENSDFDATDLLYEPALPEFTLMISSLGKAEHIRICFRKTILPASYGENKYDGGQSDYEPMIDAYVQYNSTSPFTDAVINMGVKSWKYVDSQEWFVSAFSDTVLERKATEISTENRWGHINLGEGIMRIYLSIQKALYDKPSMFIDTTQTTDRESNGETQASEVMHTKDSTNQKRRMVRVLRIVSFELEETTASEVAKTYRTYQCPSWGVIGHWRNTQTGKRVRVRPYTKGSQRADSQSYQPKDYQLIDESFMR